MNWLPASTVARGQCAHTLNQRKLTRANHAWGASVPATARRCLFSCSHRTVRRTKNRGAAAIEFAIVAPLIFFLVLASIQFAGLLMRQNLLTAAALDGARAASFPDTDSVNTVIASVEDRLTRGGIDPELVDIAINPTSLGSLNTGDSMIVTLSCPISDMMWVGPIMPPETNLSAQISCERE